MAKYGIKELVFEWDAYKELSNFQKHRVTFIEATETFLDLQGIQMLDTKHSINESRFYWVGKSKSDRVLTTWFTRRENVIRIIGCAEWRKFKRYYYEATQVK